MAVSVAFPYDKQMKKCLIELSWLSYWFVFVLLFLCTIVKESSPARFSVYQKKKRKEKVSGQNQLVPVKNQLIFFFFACNKGYVLHLRVCFVMKSCQLVTNKLEPISLIIMKHNNWMDEPHIFYSFSHRPRSFLYLLCPSSDK